MGKVCTFFGHREVYRDISEELEATIIRAVDEGYSIFWCGGYGSFDLCSAGTVKRLKKRYPHIQLVLILAYLPKHPIPEEYDSSIYPEGMETVPRRFAISKRNQWMVQHCDGTICYVNNSFGGAYQAYRQAVRQGKVLVNLGTVDRNKQE